MSVTKVFSATTMGLETIIVEVEISVESRGLPAFNIVGLADRSVEESKERVRSGIKNSGYEFPIKRITVNLAPAQIPKRGSILDLAVAVGILASSKSVAYFNLQSSMFIGELSLNGHIRHVNGSLPVVLQAKKSRFKRVYIPEECLKEVQYISGVEIYGVRNLVEVVGSLSGLTKLKPLTPRIFARTPNTSIETGILDIRGQEKAKRALEIAAAGGHNLAFCGPPGSGKTMLCKSLRDLLPELSFEESLEVTKIYSVCGLLKDIEGGLMTKRPFRSPHHSISLSGLLGGGFTPRPGEITLAHRGVLFLDEFTQLPPFVIDSLRTPVEDGEIAISRGAARYTFPSKFVLAIAYNPCPCGFFNSETKKCTCTFGDILRYRRKLGGPILDRIDLYVEVKAVKSGEYSDNRSGAELDRLRLKIQKAREIQEKRYELDKIACNADLSPSIIKKYGFLTNENSELLKKAIDRLNLSLRGFHRVIKVARTISDLESSKDILESHMMEALQYRYEATSAKV
ncbi:YifB family Mg chelatase-like AAA ATPase [candidate division WWE3 bacterium]|nr:YifB family Mg chelatase-like AAA ATPase [candidate division WWE3 bacterium]